MKSNLKSSMRSLPFLCLVILPVMLTLAFRSADKPQDIVTGASGVQVDSVCFERDILPLFKHTCAISGCHDPVTHEENLVLNSYTGIMRGITPGKPNNSSMYTRMITQNSKDKMPPPPADSVEGVDLVLVRNWILQGAKNTTCSSSGVNEPESNRMQLIVSPNPATSSASIKFTLPTNSRIQLKVIDEQGRVVTELANGPFDTGVHTLSWNCASVPSATYSIVMYAQGNTVLSRVVVAH